jgi:hypothetical protein
LTAPAPTSLPARLAAIARTLRLPPAETPPDVTGHWYRQAADIIDEARAELERLVPNDAGDLPNPLAGSRRTASPAPPRADLDALFEKARGYTMSEAEMAEQRASWVRGEMGLDRKPDADHG